VALTTIGLGLLVGAWLGRARVLILLGVLLSIALAISTAARIDQPDRRVDNITAVPTKVDEILPKYETDFGGIELDLSRVTDFTDRDVEISVYVNYGGSEFVVYRAEPADVPSGVRVGDI
jgi:hypothetical protein